MGDVVRLLRPAVSQDTIDALEALLSEARSGRVVGLAFVAIHPLNDFTVDAAGAARLSPTRAFLGAHRLARELAQLAEELDPGSK